MRVHSMMLAIAMAAVAVGPVAAADAAPAAGTVSSVTGHAFVMRDGRLLRATTSMRLLRGDRIVTRADGAARVAVRGGCSIAIGASASATVGTCGHIQTADLARSGQAGTGQAGEGATGPGAGTFAIALAGAAAMVLGIVSATQNGGQPNSP